MTDEWSVFVRSTARLEAFRSKYQDVEVHDSDAFGKLFRLEDLIGVFLTAGGRKKWKTRYNSEVDRRKELEKAHEQRTRDFDEREKEWRERDSLRGAAVRNPPDDRPL